MNKNEWKPHKKQAEFLAIPWTIKEALMGGGAGSAKTDVLLNYGICHRLHENPRFKQVFLRKTFPELRNEVVPRTRLLYKKFGATFNATQMAWTFPSGAMIFLAHCEDEQSVHQFDSMEISLFTPDELTSSLSEYSYLYIAFERVRSPKGSGLPSIIRAGSMAGGPYHTWVKSRFVDPCKTGGKVIIGKGGNKRIYIHATYIDNPHIDPTYGQTLEGLPEAEKQSKKYGNWDAYLGSVFEEFRDKHYSDEPKNACHVIEPFAIPEYWPRIIAMDWGFAPPAMTWVGYGAISPDGRIYVYREQTWQKTKIEDWCGQVKPYLDKEKPRVVKLCKSAGQDRGQEHTIHEQISSALDYPVELTTNTSGSRVAGKMLLHEYLRWKPKRVLSDLPLPVYDDEKASWLLRNKGLDTYKRYMQSLLPPEQETNIPRLQIFNTCTKLIEAIRICSYDKTNPEDVAEFGGDDAYDGVRYLIDAADSFVNESKDEMISAQKAAKENEEFQVTQDYNTLFLRANIGEMDKTEISIKRYR